MFLILLAWRLFKLARFAVVIAVAWALVASAQHAAAPGLASLRSLLAEAERALQINGLATPSTGRGSVPFARVTRTAECRGTGGRPDARCTPGAVRRGVSLAVICSYGYSRSVRPPVSYTEPLKLRQMRAYNLPGPASAYEEDHLVALSIGGAPRDPANLWPQPRETDPSAAQKDQLETWAARMACSRRIPLGELQRDMARDWVALFARAGGTQVLSAYQAGG